MSQNTDALCQLSSGQLLDSAEPTLVHVLDIPSASHLLPTCLTVIDSLFAAFNHVVVLTGSVKHKDLIRQTAASVGCLGCPSLLMHLARPYLASRGGTRLLRRMVRQTLPAIVHSWGEKSDELAESIARIVLAAQVRTRSGCSAKSLRAVAARERKPMRADHLFFDNNFSLNCHALTTQLKGHYSGGTFNCTHIDPVSDWKSLSKYGREKSEVAAWQIVDHNTLADYFELPPETKFVGMHVPLCEDTAGVETAIWSIDLLQVIRDDVHLLIFGEGERRVKDRFLRFRRQVNTTEKVHFLGEDWQLRTAVLPHLDLWWDVSHFGFMSGSLVQAMENGISVVASDIPQHRERITDDARGKLVPFEDTASLAKWTNVILNEEANQTSEGNAAEPSSLFAEKVENLVEQHDLVYNELLNARTDSFSEKKPK